MPLTRYEQMENTSNVAQRKNVGPPALKCNKCGSTWFSIKTFAQYQADFVVTLGMEPPMIYDSPICNILQCVCGELFEVRANRLANNELNKKYDDFLDTVEGKK
jgi:hypothetical protein